MAAIAWAIIFFAVCVLDAAYITKFGATYAGAGAAVFVAFYSLMMCTISTVYQLRSGALVERASEPGR